MEPIVTLDEERNKVIAKYTKAEFEVYAKGDTKVEDFGKISKFWLSLGNPDGTVNSAYGHLIFFSKSCGNPAFEQAIISRPDSDASLTMRTPWEWARLALLLDPDTRQAIIKFHKHEHLWVGNKDQTCTVYGNFLMRENQLHLIIHMRSNDVVKGLVYDMPWFCYLLERMVSELKQKYPDLTVGTYTHIADSFHVYETDYEKAKSMTGIQ